MYRYIALCVALVLVVISCSSIVVEASPKRSAVKMFGEPIKEIIEAAIEKGHIGTIKTILKRIDCPEKIFSDSTLLCLAIEKGHISIVKLFHQYNVDINHANLNKETPLHVAARHGHLEILEFLIEKGAAVNVTDSTGDTPLHYAAYYGHSASVAILLHHGADKTVVNDDGDTPIDEARLEGHKDIATHMSSW